MLNTGATGCSHDLDLVSSPSRNSSNLFHSHFLMPCLLPVHIFLLLWGSTRCSSALLKLFSHRPTQTFRQFSPQPPAFLLDLIWELWLLCLWMTPLNLDLSNQADLRRLTCRVRQAGSLSTSTAFSILFGRNLMIFSFLACQLKHKKNSTITQFLLHLVLYNNSYTPFSFLPFAPLTHHAWPWPKKNQAQRLHHPQGQACYN